MRNQYLHTLWLAFLLLTSCNTGEMVPTTLQVNPGMTNIDALQVNPGMATSDTTYFIKLLFEGIKNYDLNRVILGKRGGAPIGALSDYTGNTPLIEAIKQQDIDVIHYL